jgi:hypothetical protein
MWAEFSQRTRTCNGWRVSIRGNRGKKLCRIRAAVPGRMERFGISLEAFAVRSVPAFDRRRGPLRRFVGVAIVAGIWCPELYR